MIQFDLVRIFTEWNLRSFDGILPIPELRWNSRLKTSAGRFMPDRKKSTIEIASYLLDEPNAEELIRDTLGHEIIHYWLWELRKPYGHTTEFHAKMNELGVSRYNSVPRHRPFKHCYICAHCDQKIWVRKKLEGAACAACCNTHAEGKYHKSFMLQLATNVEMPAAAPSKTG